MNLNTILLVMVLLVLALGAGAAFGVLGVILAIIASLWLLVAGLDRIAAWYHSRSKVPKPPAAPLPPAAPPPSLLQIVNASPAVSYSTGERIRALLICLFYGAILALFVLA